MFNITTTSEPETREAAPIRNRWIPVADAGTTLRQVRFNRLGTGTRQAEDVSASDEKIELTDQDILVHLRDRVPSRGRMRVLQSWVGSVLEKKNDETFIAIVRDLTDPLNPEERLELDTREVSLSDLPLLQAGSAFYWTIGYRDSDQGQRERISSIRFVRRPTLDKFAKDRVAIDAETLAKTLKGE